LSIVLRIAPHFDPSPYETVGLLKKRNPLTAKVAKILRKDRKELISLARICNPC